MMINFIKSNESLLKILLTYWISEMIRFSANIIIFVMIFRELSVGQYAFFTIIQSLTGLLVILLSLNVDSSMQKVYSKKYVRSYGDLSYLILIISIFSASIFSVYIIDQLVIIDIYFAWSTEISPIKVYIYSLALIMFGNYQSYLNATRKNGRFVVLSILQPVILLSSLSFSNDLSLNQVINCYILALFSSLILCFELSKLRLRRVQKTRLIIILKYILSYSLPSFPTIGSKSMFDYVARISVYSFGGDVSVAALGFVNTLFSVFRSIEKVFFRAITPLLLMPKFSKKENNLVKFIIIIKIFCIVVISFRSDLWSPYIWTLFPEKPFEIFSSNLVLLMSVVYSLSLIKNYFMAWSKRNIQKIKRFYLISSILHISGCAVFFYFNLSAEIYITSLIIINFLNIAGLWSMSKVINIKGGV